MRIKNSSEFNWYYFKERVTVILKKSLTSSDKLRLGSEFAYMREHGKKYVGRYLLLVVAPSTDNSLRCGVVCGKKYSSKAVTRNRARRLLLESFRLLKQRIQVAHLVMIPRKFIMTAKQQAVQTDLQALLDKANIIEK